VTSVVEAGWCIATVLYMWGMMHIIRSQYTETTSRL